MKEWFEEWFDTKYYELLYRDRDNEEASEFIKEISRELQIAKHHRVLDVGCGTGRHARELREFSNEVCGIDLSKNKIEKALSQQKEGMEFFTHDMRHLFRINYYDFVFNLFTSFGYFNSRYDELNAAHSLAANLKKGGRLIIDYLNTSYVLTNFNKQVKKTVDQVEFHIDKRIEKDWIIKEIQVCTEDSCTVYYEKVRLYSKLDLENLFSTYKFTLIQSFGSYKLSPYDATHSERMILVFEKQG